MLHQRAGFHRNRYQEEQMSRQIVHAFIIDAGITPSKNNDASFTASLLP
ncbi:hypothetical protein [Proteiniclasticum sp.]|nr:hypothetical protein [Proteiniclasticum sp.]